MKRIFTLSILTLAVLATGCTRIETGEVGEKEVEVKTAEAESRRMAALANNSGASIAFMQAQAMLNISEGIKNGQVQTIVVPSNFNALMMNK